MQTEITAKLPQEILLMVLEHLNAPDRLNARLCAKEFASLVTTVDRYDGAVGSLVVNKASEKVREILLCFQHPTELGRPKGVSTQDALHGRIEEFEPARRLLQAFHATPEEKAQCQLNFSFNFINSDAWAERPDVQGWTQARAAKHLLLAMPKVDTLSMIYTDMPQDLGMLLSIPCFDFLRRLDLGTCNGSSYLKSKQVIQLANSGLTTLSVLHGKFMLGNDSMNALTRFIAQQNELTELKAILTADWPRVQPEDISLQPIEECVPPACSVNLRFG